MNLKSSDLKSVGQKRKIANFKISKFPNRRNPIYKLRLENGIPCKFCIEKQQYTSGHQKIWRSLNSLHGHLAYDHYNEEFKQWLISLAKKIIRGDLK